MRVLYFLLIFIKFGLTLTYKKMGLALLPFLFHSSHKYEKISFRFVCIGQLILCKKPNIGIG